MGSPDPDLDPYAGIGPEVIHCPEHRALALRAVTVSVVLLKNDGLLPLDPERAPRIAVIGPHADALYKDWYSGTMPYQVGIATGLRAALADGGGHVVRVPGADRIRLPSRTSGKPLGGTSFDVQEWGDGVLTLCDTDTGRYLGVQDDASLVTDRALITSWFVDETFRLEPAPDGEGDTFVLHNVRTGRYAARDPAEATVGRFIGGMAERGIPLSVFHFDCFWMRAHQWCDFAWDAETFPDPEGMLARLKQRGLRVCAWTNPYIAQKSPLFEEGMREGHLVRRPDGSVWQWDLWRAGMALVDFTDPAAREWYTGKLRTLLAQGVDCFKTDFGERIPTDVVWHDGSDPERMHNYYTHLYNQAVFDLLREERGEGEAMLFARSATAGGQQYPVHWGGDCDSRFNAMAESLRGGLSLGLSGFGFWSHDIGGFEGTPTPTVFKRWVHFGLPSSHSRLHGSLSYRVPWDYGEEAVGVTREFTLLEHRLALYLQRAAQQAHTTGIPVMRAMALEFPGDPTAGHLDR